MRLLDFNTHFPNEASCKKHFKQYRDKEGIGSNCEGMVHNWVSKKWMYECKNCCFCTSLKKCTLMENSKLTFRTWYQILLFISATKPEVFKEAMETLVEKGFYYSKRVGKLMLDQMQNGGKNLVQMNDREQEFLQWACTELTYKEIAEKMFVSPRTIDGYRESLFEKLKVKNRVGLAMYAIKSGIYKIV